MQGFLGTLDESPHTYFSFFRKFVSEAHTRPLKMSTEVETNATSTLLLRAQFNPTALLPLETNFARGSSSVFVGCTQSIVNSTAGPGPKCIGGPTEHSAKTVACKEMVSVRSRVRLIKRGLLIFLVVVTAGIILGHI